MCSSDLKGQTDAVIKMLEEERYCMDISNQLLAVQSLVKKANMLVLEQHLAHCVKEACEANAADEKMREIMMIIEKVMK